MCPSGCSCLQQRLAELLDHHLNWQRLLVKVQGYWQPTLFVNTSTGAPLKGD